MKKTTKSTKKEQGVPENKKKNDAQSKSKEKKTEAKADANKEPVLMTVQPAKQKSKEEIEREKKEKEELEKQRILLKQIKECEEKLKFEQEQRAHLIELKKKEIEKKERTIEQMTQTNQKLQTELEILQVEVQQKLDKMEFKEKNDVFENEKQKRQAPLEQLLKVKENELKNSMKIIESYKKEKENLQKQLEEKVDIVQINSLNDQIKIANEKISDMQKEIKYLSKVKEEHNKCMLSKLCSTTNSTNLNTKNEIKRQQRQKKTTF